jgi:polar amino acid transport system substrate-binding protein
VTTKMMMLVFLALCSGHALLFSEKLKAQEVNICISDWNDYTLYKPKKPEDPKNDLGYMADLVKAAFKSQGYDVKYSWLPSSRGFQYTKEGKADAFLGAYESEIYDYIGNQEPIGRLRSHFLVSQQESWRFTDEASLFKAQGIGIWEGYDYIDPIFSKYMESKPENLFFLPDDNDVANRAVKMVHSGRLTAIVADPGSINYYIKKNKLEGLVDAGQCLKPEYLYACFSPVQPKRSKRLADLLDEGIKKIRSTGQLEKILKKYDLEDWALSAAKK